MNLPFLTVVLYSPSAPGIQGQYPGIGDYVPGAAGLYRASMVLSRGCLHRMSDAAVPLWLGASNAPQVLALPWRCFNGSRVYMRLCAQNGDSRDGG